MTDPMTKIASTPAVRINRRRALAIGAAAGAGALVGLRSHPAFAVHIGIGPGAQQPLPIGIPNFNAGTPSDQETAANVTQIITDNLRRSGLFAPIDPAAFLEKVISFDATPRFPDWRVIN